jgi:glycerol-3-phosphate dehydrogenase
MSEIFARETQVARLESEDRPWDIVVIGGGASGVGVAVDAAARGYRVALLEQHDFGKGTSSRSTKLIHGGLRYLKQGRIRLVHEALVERGILRQNAPHLVHPLPTIVPLYSRWETIYYGLGLKVYERLSGRWSLGPSRRLTVDQTLNEIPTLERAGLRGGALYLDGIFDDTRLLINLVQTAIEHGAVCLNYAPVRELIKQSGRVCGVVAEDTESGKMLRIAAKVVVNATGPFTDQILKLDDPSARSVVAPSQGIHLTFDREFLPCSSALIIPKTRDGRVVFAVPWHHHAIVGTTDTARDDTPLEPRPLPGEIEFLLETISPYLSRKPQRADIRSVYTGIRPLVRAADARKTSQLGRDHEVRVSADGLVSLLGGKWTTYRRMAEECVDRAAKVAGLAEQPSRTKTLAIHGHPTLCAPSQLCAGLPTSRESAGSGAPRRTDDSEFAEYGSDAGAVNQSVSDTPGGTDSLDKRLPYVSGQVTYAARREMARSVEDVLARRLRALFLDAEAAIAAAPRVAEVLAAEFRRDTIWQKQQIDKFLDVAAGYQPTSS